VGVAVTTALLPRGSRFGDIKLTGYLGSGGFSDVYAGQDSSGQRLAVKVLRLTGLNVAQQTQRVRREQEALARVGSRGVAKLISADLTADQPWIASEFVDGPTLKESIETQGPLTYDETLGLIRRLAEIVAELHELGIAHRDITPNNIIFGPDGPVLIDFGSARIDLENEATGSILLAGTPGFTPPEAEAGLAVGKKADIYALGKLFAYCQSEAKPPAVLVHACDPEPEQRPTPQTIAGALGGTTEPPARSHTRAIRKLPRRYKLRTVALSSVFFVALTASFGYLAFVKADPVRSMTSDQIQLFDSDSGARPERVSLGSPYFRDPAVPPRTTLRRDVLVWSEADNHPNPFNNTRTLDAIAFVQEPLLGQVVSITAEVAPRSLMSDSDTYPDFPQIPARELNELNQQFLRDVATLGLSSPTCTLNSPDYGAHLSSLDLFVIGTSSTCGSDLVISYTALQPSSRTLFRLHGRLAESRRDDVLLAFLSSVNPPAMATPSTQSLNDFLLGASYVENVFSRVGYKPRGRPAEGVIGGSSFGINGRVAVTLTPGESFIPVVLDQNINIWALVDGESTAQRVASALTVGQFFTLDPTDSPIIDNYLETDIIVVVEVNWSGDDPHELSFVAEEYWQPELLPYADSLFESFAEVTTSARDWVYEESVTVDEVRDIVEESGLPSDTSFTMFDHDLLLASSQRMLEAGADLFNYAALGEVILPVPTNLSLTTASLGGTTYAIRGDELALRSTVFERGNDRDVIIRNSEVVLPGTIERATTDLEVIDTGCRTFRSASRPVGELTLTMTLQGNCMDRGIAMSPSSNDRIKDLFPRVRIVLSEETRYGWNDQQVAEELLTIDAHIGYVDDLAYVRLLLVGLDYFFEGTTAEEARGLLGRPDYDVGRFNSNFEPLKP
jgi:serine/threonine protein kinase